MEETNLRRFGYRLLKAYAVRDFSRVTRTAHQYLALAEHNRHAPDYGTAVHQANTLLGLVELERGQVEVAAGYLLRSARTPGSRQIMAFGPNMLLAYKLLQRNQEKAVVRYLDMCRGLWKLSFGTLRRWRRQILMGRTPNFGANLSYLTDYRSFG